MGRISVAAGAAWGMPGWHFMFFRTLANAGHGSEAQWMPVFLFFTPIGFHHPVLRTLPGKAAKHWHG